MLGSWHTGGSAPTPACARRQRAWSRGTDLALSMFYRQCARRALAEPRERRSRWSASESSATRIGRWGRGGRHLALRPRIGGSVRVAIKRSSTSASPAADPRHQVLLRGEASAGEGRQTAGRRPSCARTTPRLATRLLRGAVGRGGLAARAARRPGDAAWAGSGATTCRGRTPARTSSCSAAAPARLRAGSWSGGRERHSRAWRWARRAAPPRSSIVDGETGRLCGARRWACWPRAVLRAGTIPQPGVAKLRAPGLEEAARARTAPEAAMAQLADGYDRIAEPAESPHPSSSSSAASTAKVRA